MKIAIYILEEMAKANYAVESYSVRKNAGIEMVRDALERNGRIVGYCGRATVSRYDVVLVSITSGCDWWPYIRERKSWKGFKGVVVIGGAGLLNIRPFLNWFDVAVFGRGESVINDIVDCAETKTRLQHDGVAYSEDFSPQNNYKIIQAQRAYPHEITMSNGKRWKEESIGCHRSCLFCAYSYQRKPVNVSKDGSYTSGSDKEYTLLDLDIDNPYKWQQRGQMRIVALDGASERLRKMVNKPITRERLQGFIRGLCSLKKPHQIKMYNLLGIPGETQDDWREMLDDIKTGDALCGNKKWSIVLHNTPFRAMPCTPAQLWPMSYVCYRKNSISGVLKQRHMPGNVFYQGKGIWCVESMGTDSLASVQLDAIVLRGDESHAQLVQGLACSKRYWSASSAQKIATIEAGCDIKRLFGAYRQDEYPVRYLSTWRKTHATL